MTRQNLLSALKLSTFVFVCSANIALANGDVASTHRVVLANDLSSHSQITYSFSIENSSTNGLSNVYLEPVGLPLIDGNNNEMLHIGRIPAGGIVDMEWTVLSKMQTPYFLSGSPLTFRVTAITDNGEHVDFPLYSKVH